MAALENNVLIGKIGQKIAATQAVLVKICKISIFFCVRRLKKLTVCGIMNGR